MWFKFCEVLEDVLVEDKKDIKIRRRSMWHRICDTMASFLRDDEEDVKTKRSRKKKDKKTEKEK